MPHLVISKEHDTFVVDDPTIPGSPPVGRGRTMMEALGRWLHHNRTLVHVEIDVDESAQAAVENWQKRELAKR